MLGGGDGLPAGHHGPSRQQLVDPVEDLPELRPRVGGDLADGDGGGFLQLQLQLLRLSQEEGNRIQTFREKSIMK